MWSRSLGLFIGAALLTLAACGPSPMDIKTTCVKIVTMHPANEVKLLDLLASELGLEPKETRATVQSMLLKINDQNNVGGYELKDCMKDIKGIVK